MSTLQDQSRPVKTPKAETVALDTIELTPRERAQCDHAAQQALGRLFAEYRQKPGWRVCPRGEAFRVAQAAQEEARARCLAERYAPAQTAWDALWAAELRRQARQAIEAEEAEEAEEASEAFGNREPADDWDLEHGGPTAS